MWCSQTDLQSLAMNFCKQGRCMLWLHEVSLPRTSLYLVQLQHNPGRWKKTRTTGIVLVYKLLSSITERSPSSLILFFKSRYLRWYPPKKSHLSFPTSKPSVSDVFSACRPAFQQSQITLLVPFPVRKAQKPKQLPVSEFFPIKAGSSYAPGIAHRVPLISVPVPSCPLSLTPVSQQNGDKEGMAPSEKGPWPAMSLVFRKWFKWCIKSTSNPAINNTAEVLMSMALLFF